MSCTVSGDTWKGTSIAHGRDLGLVIFRLGGLPPRPLARGDLVLDESNDRLRAFASWAASSSGIQRHPRGRVDFARKRFKRAQSWFCCKGFIRFAEVRHIPTSRYFFFLGGGLINPCPRVNPSHFFFVDKTPNTFCLTKICFYLNFFWPNFFLTKFFFDQIFFDQIFFTNIFFPKNLWRKICFQQKKF